MVKSVSIIILLLSAGYVCSEDLTAVKGAEADEVVNIVITALTKLDSFELTILTTRTSDFFEPVVTKGVVVWQKPMYAKWTEFHPKTKKMESVTVLTPEAYSHYIKELNTVEILDFTKKKNMEKVFQEYTSLFQGGYEKLKKKYTFLVFRVKEKKDKDKSEKAEVKKEENKKDTKDKEDKKEKAAPEKQEGKEKGDAKKPPKDPLKEWEKACMAFEKKYGRSPAQYRLKFQPQAKAVKKEVLHINFVISGKTVISKIIIARADGDVITTDISDLSKVNKKQDSKVFVFEVPKDAKKQFLMED
jgi:hypothetical protein